MKIFASFLSGALICAPLLAHADANFPSRPLTLVVTQAAGGGMDGAARMLGKKLSGVLGQPLVIENKPGAGENIGINTVAKAAPDGYTLLFCSNSITINPTLYKSLPYDAKKELKPVGKIASVPLLMVAAASEPYRDFAGLIAHAKANPGKLSYGSPGTGLAHHLAMELVKSAAGINIQHIPYKGAAPGLNDLLAGTIPILMASVPPVEPHIKAGKLRALAVTSKARLPQFADVPTIGEALPGIDVDAWMAIFVPADTPETIRDKLADALKATVNDQEVVAQLARMSMIASWLPPGDMTSAMAREEQRWAAAIKEAGIKPD